MSLPIPFPALLTAMFSIAFLYLALLFSMAWRLDRLKAAGATDALSFQEFLFTGGGLKAVGFLFSGRHRRLGDTTVSAIVYVCRILFVVYMPLFAVVFFLSLSGAAP